MNRLDDKTVVITGAAGGIGSAAARLMAGEGARVLLADRDPERVESVARTIREQGGTAVATPVDVLDEDSIAAMLDKAVSELGGPHVLCNHVGGSDPNKDTDLLTMDLAEWDRVMNLNMRSTMVASRLAIPHMIAEGGGSIINTASVAGVQGDAVRCAYGAAKAGVISLTRYIAAQYGPRGVRCNTIAPGATMTPSLRDNLPTEVVDEIRRNTSLESIGEPEDIGHAMVHLASDESRYTTGQLLVIDGGLTTQSAFTPGPRDRTHQTDTPRAGTPAR